MDSKDKQEEQKESIGDYVDNYTITPNYEHPRFKELMTEFEKQEHRFEIDTCEFKYNGKSFFLGDSPEKIVEVFGQPDGGEIITLDQSSTVFDFESLNLLMSFSNSSKTLESYSLDISDRKRKNVLYQIIIFRNIPYSRDMNFNEFLELSNAEISKFRRASGTFFTIQKECPPNDLERVYTSIGSTPVYESKGIGHMTFSGDFNPEKSNPIRNISISTITLNEFLK